MFESQIANDTINWNGGQRITLYAGQTARCTSLSPGQLYGIFMYNSAQNQTTATVNVVWTNSQPPQPVTVPGTTANAGLASVLFVSGSDTQTISISLPSNAGIAQVDVWLGSVSMPIDTSGLNNLQLPLNGEPQSFDKYTRYYTVPPSSWYQLVIKSPVQQFISVQFREAKAVVYVVSEGPNGLLNGQVSGVGSAASAFTKSETSQQSVTANIFGDGSQWVWMNADSQQDSDNSTIAVQSLSF